MKRTIIFFSLAFFLLIMGCATIITKGKQDIKINSSPENATITIKDYDNFVVFSGKTPATVKLKRKNKYIVDLELKGYKKATIKIDQDFELSFLGNIICGSLIGMAVDFISGSVYKLDPQDINFNLVTAMHNNIEETYVVIKTMDNNNQIRTMALPLIKE